MFATSVATLAPDVHDVAQLPCDHRSEPGGEEPVEAAAPVALEAVHHGRPEVEQDEQRREDGGAGQFHESRFAGHHGPTWTHASTGKPG